MEQKEIMNDLKEIRQMMEKSSRFISLSGLSGVFAGIYASVAALLAFPESWNPLLHIYMWDPIAYLLILALSVLTLSIATAYIFTYRNAQKKQQTMWGPTTLRFMVNLGIPLISGAVICLALIHRGYYDILSSAMLIFYGIALFNAGRYTLKDIRYLGLTELALGCISLFFTGAAIEIIFWALGFGVCHIVYGLWMYFHYEK